MTEKTSSVPEVAEDDDLDASLEAMRQAEREDDGGQSGDAPDGEESEPQAEAKPGDDGALEPLPYDELQRRHEDLKKALHAERAQKRDLAEDRQWRQTMEARLAEMQAKAGPEAKREDAEEKPDRTKDPLAYLDWLDKKVSEYETQTQQEREQQERQAQYQRQLSQIQAYGAKAEEEIRKEHGDYDEAASFYAQSRLTELQGVYGMDEQAAQQYFRQELQAAIVQNAQRGNNPAAAIYAAAKARGYAPASDEAKPERASNGQYQKMKDGQKASKTLSGSGGKVKTDATIQSLLDSDDDPLDAVHRGEESEFDRQFNAFARASRRA